MDSIRVFLVEIQDSTLRDMAFRFPTAFLLAITFPVNQKFVNHMVTAFVNLSLKELLNLIGWAFLGFDRRRKSLMMFRDGILQV